MKAAKAKIVYSHNAIHVVDIDDHDYDRSLYPYEFRLDSDAPHVAIIKAIVTLTNLGLRSRHVHQALMRVDEFRVLFEITERKHMKHRRERKAAAWV